MNGFKTLRTDEWIIENPGMTCEICKDKVFTKIVKTADGVQRSHCCTKFFFNDEPEFAAHEFRGVSGIMTPKELCDEVAKWKLPETFKYGLKNLAWLNEVIALPTLYNIMTGNKAQSIPERKVVDLLKKTAKYRSDNFSNASKQAKLDIMKLNRYILERKITGSPRLYLDNLTICNWTKEIK